MRSTIKLLLATVAILAVMCAGAAFADLPEKMPEDIAKLVVTDNSDAPPAGVELLPHATLKETFEKLDEIGGGPAKGKSYDEIKTEYFGGVDGVVCESKSSAEDCQIAIAWFAGDATPDKYGVVPAIRLTFVYDEAWGKGEYDGYPASSQMRDE